MTEHTNPGRDDPERDIPDALAPLLASEAIWADADETVVDDVAAAVAAEATPPRAGSRVAGSVRRWLAPVAVGVAAAVLVLVGASVFDGGPERGAPGLAVSLSGTELAPTASAVATVADTPLGTRIDLDVTGLTPAGEDEYYEAWLWRDGDEAVSAGSFHLRGGDGSIELWAGVGLDDYPRMSVTRQTEGAGTEPSDAVVLRS